MAARKKAAKSKAKKPARRPAARKAKAPKRAARQQPETLRLRVVSAGLTVNDIDASIAWYRDVLGCVVQETWTSEGKVQGAVMRSGNATIYLGQDDWKKGRDRKKGEGVRFYCTTVQDIDKLAAQMTSRGARLTHEPVTQSWGVRDFGVIDPDGYRITIQTPA